MKNATIAMASRCSTHPFRRNKISALGLSSCVKIVQNSLGVVMNNMQISHVEAFINETENVRKLQLSKEDIKRINNFSREVVSEDSVVV